jgi:quercetin dioxygenase-like cupin family protein
MTHDSQREFTGALDGPDAEATNEYLAELDQHRRSTRLVGNLSEPVLQSKLFGVTVSLPINWLRLSDRKLDYVIFDLDPGEGFDRHLHGYGEELYLVRRGRGIVEIDGTEHEAGPEDIFHLAVGIVHTVWNPAENREPFSFLLINAPAIAYHLRRHYWSMFVGEPLASLKTER